jgi:hypothetical protein
MALLVGRRAGEDGSFAVLIRERRREKDLDSAEGLAALVDDSADEGLWFGSRAGGGSLRQDQEEHRGRVHERISIEARDFGINWDYRGGRDRV